MAFNAQPPGRPPRKPGRNPSHPATAAEAMARKAKSVPDAEAAEIARAAAREEDA